jgi:hypothetical protein
MARFKTPEQYANPTPAPEPVVQATETEVAEPVVDERTAFGSTLTTPQAQQAFREGKTISQCEGIEEFHLQRKAELDIYNQELLKRAQERLQAERDAPRIAAEKAAEAEAENARSIAAHKRKLAEAAARQQQVRDRVRAEAIEKEQLREQQAQSQPEGRVLRLTPTPTCRDNYCAVPLDGTPHKNWCSERFRRANESA